MPTGGDSPLKHRPLPMNKWIATGRRWGAVLVIGTNNRTNQVVAHHISFTKIDHRDAGGVLERLQRLSLDICAYANFRCTTVGSTWRLACAIRRAKAGRMAVL